VVEARGGGIPDGLEQRLLSLDPGVVRDLLSRVVRAEDVEAVQALIAAV